jgi:capsular exopolysaccharide synthesis family protein
MELRPYLSILWKWAWLLILAPVLSGTVSMMVSQHVEPVYRATTTLMVSPSGGSSSLDYSSLLTSERVARTYAELLTKRPLLEEVVNGLQLNLSPSQLAGKITVVQPLDTQLIELHVMDSDPQLATILANSVATTFLKEHDRRRANRAVYVEIVEPARMPAYKLRPRILFNTVVAAFAGLLITTGLIFLLEHLDDTVSHPNRVEQVLQLSALATMPSVGRRAWSKSLRDGLPLTALQPMSPLAEACRRLRTNVQFANADNGLKILLVTSALPKEGKTTLVANLGVVMAQAGMKALLVDADLRAPRLHKMFSLPNQSGLADLLLADALTDTPYLLETAVPNLYLLPAGSHFATPSDLFSSKRMKKLISHLKTVADIVLLDSPPVLAVADAAVLVSHVDDVLFVIESGRTSMAEVQQALKILQGVRATVLGMVLTRCQDGVGYYRDYYRSDLSGINGADKPPYLSPLAHQPIRSSAPDQQDPNIQ